VAEPHDDLDREILSLHREGLTDHAIGDKLGLSRTTIDRRISRMGLTSNTLRNIRGASVAHPEATSDDPVDVHDALQAHLDPQQITDMTPPFRRRELSPDEIEAATKSLAEGEALPVICQRLGVTPATLRRQVLQTLWDNWCEAHGLEKSSCPPDLDF
jgi:hypothetical protein